MIDENELQISYSQSGGPGGQNVNKVATAVVLRFDVLNSGSISAEVKTRLLDIAANQINKDGVLVIHARRYRTQQQNRADAILRLEDLIHEAGKKPKNRKKTRPSQASHLKRLQSKKRRSQIKQLRQKFKGDRE